MRMSLLGDFDYGVLSQVAHRPWPMPRRPWLMTQTWHDLLFAHWAVKESELQPHIPAEFELDTSTGSRGSASSRSACRMSFPAACRPFPGCRRFRN